MRPLGLALCIALCATSVRADDALEDPDHQAARRHYELGRTFYDEQRYGEACGEFELARRLLVLPALDYNLARCEERLEHWDRARALYERYVGEVPASTDTTTVRARIAELALRTTPSSSVTRMPPPATRMPPLRIAAIAVAAGTVALAAAGTGAYLSEWHAYEHERDACHHDCTQAQIASLESRAKRGEHAGYALWGLAAATAVVDVVLWTIDTRRSRRAARAIDSVVTW